MRFMNECYLLKMNLLLKKLIPLGKIAFLTHWSPGSPGECPQIKDTHKQKKCMGCFTDKCCSGTFQTPNALK